MPPQAANSSTDTVTISGAKLEVIRATLCRMDFKGVFIAVGEDLGLAQPKTASSRFRDAIAPLGLELKDGKVTRAGEAGNKDDGAAAMPPATPAKRKASQPIGGATPTPKKAKTPKGAAGKAKGKGTGAQDESDEGLTCGAEGKKVDTTHTKPGIKDESAIEDA